MIFFKPLAYIDYVPCRLTEGADNWYIFYYVKDPQTCKMKRFRMKLNRIKPLRERRRAARAIMADIDTRLAMGWNPLLDVVAPKNGTGLYDAFEVFLEIKKKEMESNSIRCYQSFIKTFRTWLDKHGFDGTSCCTVVTKGIAIEFMDDFELELSAKTYNNYLAFYRSLFNWMKSKGYVAENPFENIAKKAKRLTKKKRRILTDEELGTLWSFLEKENPEYMAMCMICYCCFIRPKEIALLKCGDIDLQNQVIHVREEIAKNDNDSYRTIPDDLVPILARLDLSRPDWYVFGQHDRGDFGPGKKKMCSRKIAQWWNVHVRHACKFEMDVQFYSLKDTGITNMLGTGVSIDLVKKQADHSSITMTEIYVGLRADADEKLRAATILKK